MSDSSEEKTLPASQHKLREQRKKGNVVNARDSLSSLVGITALGYIYIRLDYISEKFSELFILPDNADAADFTQTLAAKLEVVGLIAVEIVAPLFAAVIGVAILGGMAIAGGPVFSTEPIVPKFEKLNPASGFKRIFGRRAFMTFLMHMVRATTFCVVFALVLYSASSVMMEAPVCGFPCVVEALKRGAEMLIIAAIVVMLIFALIDYIIQRSEFMREQKMSISEFKRERKNQEGDPQMAGQRKRDRQELMTTTTGAKHATLLVDGSPNFVVGVRYVQEETPAPIIVIKAKGSESTKKLVKSVKTTAIFNAELAKDLARIQVGGFVTEEETIKRLAPLLQQANAANAA